MTGLEGALQGDAVSRLVGALLLLMSVASWVVILWKSWLLQRASRDVVRCIAAFWQSAQFEEALQKIKAFDRETIVLPMLEATQIEAKNEQNPMLAWNVCQRLTERLWTFRRSEFLPEASNSAADLDFLQIIQLSPRKQALLPCLHETD